MISKTLQFANAAARGALTRLAFRARPLRSSIPRKACREWLAEPHRGSSSEPSSFLLLSFRGTLHSFVRKAFRRRALRLDCFQTDYVLGELFPEPSLSPRNSNSDCWSKADCPAARRPREH